MSNINKSIFILLTIICRYAIGETECSHYYIPMVESSIKSFYFMEPANTSEVNLDAISDIGVPRNCILLFNCFQIENDFCERPLVLEPNIGKTEFIGSNATLIPTKTRTLLTTTIPTTAKQETLTTTIFSTMERGEQLVEVINPTTVEKEQLATTPILTIVKEKQLTNSLTSMTAKVEQLTSTPISTTEEELLVSTPISTTEEEEQLATTPIPTIVKEKQLTNFLTSMTAKVEQLTSTPISTTEKEQKLTTTFSTTVEQQPANNANELDDKYLIKINDNCKLNLSVFIKKNGCKVNLDDDDNGTLIYDCENLLIDNCKENLESKDQVYIDKLKETHCMNYTITMKETASDKGFILQLSSETGRGILSKNDKNACTLSIVCYNDTHTKCKSIESKTIWKSSELLYTTSTPPLSNNSIEILKCLNGSEKGENDPLKLASNMTKLNTHQKLETSSISTLLENENALNQSTLSNNTNCNEGVNCEKNKSVATNSNEGKIYTATDLNEIVTNRSSIAKHEISTNSYSEDIKNDDITLPSTTVIEEISSGITTSKPEITTAVDIDTTFGTTLNDESIKSSKHELIKNENEQNNILPILMITFGSVAILTSIYLLIRKCNNLMKSGEYHIPETVEMGQGFTAL